MPETLAILVGGGPAPGINGVIAAATREAERNGRRVIGVQEGYRYLALGDPSHAHELTSDDVEGIERRGGSVLGTSRTNPSKDEQTLANCVTTLEALGVKYLVTIGGDDTTSGARRISEETRGKISVAAVPKTIDNDLPLPEGIPTFGYETARSVGAGIVSTLVEDARTTGSRWYVAVTMGRSSGALTLGIAAASGATRALIPESYLGREIRMAEIVDTIVGSILKRRSQGRNSGVVLVAEGMAELLASDLATSGSVGRDAYGNVLLADLPLGMMLADAINKRLLEFGVSMSIVAKDIGYELRCAPPVAFDIEYTRALGYGAVRYLLGGGSGALISYQGGKIVPLTFDDLRDPKTQRIRTRIVDITSDNYQIAQAFSTRLDEDNHSHQALSAMARDSGGTFTRPA